MLKLPRTFLNVNGNVTVATTAGTRGKLLGTESSQQSSSEHGFIVRLAVLAEYDDPAVGSFPPLVASIPCVNSTVAASPGNIRF